MADYWKSQPRHFCEFCKCWTADNKASRDFHEQGKRHQENVKKKLDDLRKKGFEDARREKQTSSYLKQMEKAALSKLKEDLKQDPSLASQYGVVIKSKADSGTVNAKASSSTSKTKTVSSSADAKTDVSAAVSNWCEATTAEGYVYYWNSVTNESRWELPNDINETPAKSPATANTSAGTSKPRYKPSTSADEPVTKKKKPVPEKPPASTKVETGVVQRDSQPSVSAASTPASTTSQPAAYGAWRPVEPAVVQPTIDLQLPQDTDAVEVKTVTIPSEPKLKFHEKKVASLSTSGNAGGVVGFRKSKFGANRSIRSTNCAHDS